MYRRLYKSYAEKSKMKYKGKHDSVRMYTFEREKKIKNITFKISVHKKKKIILQDLTSNKIV